jgi:hypothetical protein
MRRFDTTAKTHRPVYTDVRRFGTGNNILCTRPYSLDYLLLRCRRTAGSMLSTARRSDLELRARIFLDHRCLYEPDGPAWARRVTSPAWSIDGKLWSPWRRLLAYLGYAALIRRYYPSLVRPLFWRPPIPWQRRLRALARLAGLQR